MSRSTATISIDELKPGIVLPVKIFDGDNLSVLLLNHGKYLTEPLIRRLKNRGITRVAVDSAFVEQLTRPPGSEAKTVLVSPVPKTATPAEDLPVTLKPRSAEGPFEPALVERAVELREDHSARMYEVYQASQRTGTVPATTLQNITYESVMCLIDDLDIFVGLCIAPSHQVDGSEHPMRVAQLALSVGAVMGFTRAQLSALGIGCLLHRIGMTESARRLTELSRPLTEFELLELRKVPGRTFDFMQKLHNIPPASLQVAYQIYERWNGSGYPRGRGGIQINIMARVAAVCDTFVSLTTQRKQTRPPEKYAAITRIVDMTRKGLFDPTSVRGLLQTVSLYPLGSFVVLNDGCTGRVMRTNPTTYDRPVVQLMNPFNGDLTSSTLDLSLNSHLKVIEVTEEVQCAFAA